MREAQLITNKKKTTVILLKPYHSILAACVAGSSPRTSSCYSGRVLPRPRRLPTGVQKNTGKTVRAVSLPSAENLCLRHLVRRSLLGARSSLKRHTMMACLRLGINLLKLALIIRAAKKGIIS